MLRLWLFHKERDASKCMHTPRNIHAQQSFQEGERENIIHAATPVEADVVSNGVKFEAMSGAFADVGEYGVFSTATGQ